MKTIRFPRRAVLLGGLAAFLSGCAGKFRSYDGPEVTRLRLYKGQRLLVLDGSDRVLLDAVIGFTEPGFEARVILPEDGPLRERLEAHGVEVRVVPTLVLRKALMKPRGWPSLAAGLTAGQARAMREVRDYAPDVVYVSTITQPLWPWVAKRAKAPSIVHAMLAQTRATLALAEQQRIANLIALVALSGNENVQESGYDEGSTLSSAGMHALIEYVNTSATPFTDPESVPQVRPEIQEALGLS